MATVHANKILTKFMLLLGGHNHCVKVSSDSETVRGMGLWEFSGALRELMLSCDLVLCDALKPELLLVEPSGAPGHKTTHTINPSGWYML